MKARSHCVTVMDELVRTPTTGHQGEQSDIRVPAETAPLCIARGHCKRGALQEGGIAREGHCQRGALPERGIAREGHCQTGRSCPHGHETWMPYRPFTSPLVLSCRTARWAPIGGAGGGSGFSGGGAPPPPRARPPLIGEWAGPRG